MFEQSTINVQGRPWTMAASLTMQSGIAAALVLFSVWTVDALPGLSVTTPLPPLPAAPRAVEVVAAESSMRRSSGSSSAPVYPARRGFTEPSRIPQGVNMVPDAPTGVIATGVGEGVPGAIFSGTGALGSERTVAPPTPPPPASAKKAPEAPKMVRLSTGVLTSKLVRRIVPAYPPLARNMRVSGTVRLHAVIARDGAVRDLQVLSGHPLLVQAALSAVRQWLYTPTLLNGEPVEVSAPIDVHFTLGPQ